MTDTGKWRGNITKELEEDDIFNPVRAFARDYREHHEDETLGGPDPPGGDDSPPDGFVWCSGCGINVPKEKQWVGAGGPYCLPCAMDVRVADHLGVEPWGPEFQVLTEERRRR